MSDTATRSPRLMEGGTVAWQGLFTPRQLDDLTRYCDSLALEPARLNSGESPIRSTDVAWVFRNAETEALYRRMEEVVLKLNADLFHFDLSGLATMQYAIYRDGQAGYFDWHSDYGRYRADPGQEPRKLTLSLQLSDGAEYEGCDLQIRAAFPLDVAPREKGTLVAFRSYALHRVTPITRGERRSLVVWACGPEFR